MKLFRSVIRGRAKHHMDRLTSLAYVTILKVYLHACVANA
jgi:hypothetical protein